MGEVCLAGWLVNELEIGGGISSLIVMEINFKFTKTSSLPHIQLKLLIVSIIIATITLSSFLQRIAVTAAATAVNSADWQSRHRSTNWRSQERAAFAESCQLHWRYRGGWCSCSVAGLR